jgi:hypothetical protein
MGASPNATLSATSLTFGSEVVGSPSSAQIITLSNTGTGALSNVSIDGAGSNFEETNTCGPTLIPGANCVINVTFVPGTTGDLTGTVSVNDDAPGSPQNVALFGTGTAGSTSGTLDGYCSSPNPTLPGACHLTSDPGHCPPGQTATSPGLGSCGGNPNYLDSASRCAFVRGVGTGECEVTR